MSSTTMVILGLVLAVAVLVLFTVKLKIHPFFALIATSATFAVVSGMDMQEMLSAFTSGMGGTTADIGLVIALGTVTGTLLEKSGAAETMAKTILKITGKKHAALGLAITGYFVSIPVFCDSAFVLLSPIAKRLSKDTKISMTTMAVALAMGLHATHTGASGSCRNFERRPWYGNSVWRYGINSGYAGWLLCLSGSREKVLLSPGDRGDCSFRKWKAAQRICGIPSNPGPYFSDAVKNHRGYGSL